MAALSLPNELETRALSLTEQAQVLTVRSQPDFERAGKFITEVIKPLIKEASEIFDPIIAKAHEAHKEAITQKKKIVEPLELAERTIKGEISRYCTEQERVAREARLAAEREQQRLLDEQIEREVEAAEEMAKAFGDAPEQVEAEVKAIIEQPRVYPPTPMPAVRLMPVKGVSTVDVYSAEVVNIRELCRAVADGRAGANLVLPNQPALNGLARSLKEGLSVPGVRCIKTKQVSARSAR
jgi:hypothetical protein